MKALSSALARCVSALLAGTLAACANWPGHEPQESAQAGPGPGGQVGGPTRGPAGAAPGSRTAHGTGRAIESGAGRLAMGDMMGDLQAMCELDRRMRAARTPEARHAMIDKYMGAMTPETRHHLLTMMREQCQ